MMSKLDEHRSSDWFWFWFWNGEIRRNQRWREGFQNLSDTPDRTCGEPASCPQQAQLRERAPSPGEDGEAPAAPVKLTSADLQSLKKNPSALTSSTQESAVLLLLLLTVGVRRQQSVLSVGQNEGQRGQDGVVQDSQHGQDVGPVDRAVTWREAAHLVGHRKGGVRKMEGGAYLTTKTDNRFLVMVILLPW